MNKILVLVAGSVGKHATLSEEAQKLGIDLTVSSFSKLEYVLSKDDMKIMVDGRDLDEFSLIYIRLVGKRREDVGVVVNYAKDKGIKLIDEIFEKSRTFTIPLPKSIEAKLLLEAGIQVPGTYFASLKMIKENASKMFGFPFVIKSTSGRQGRGVWSPESQEELEKIVENVSLEEKQGKRYIAQEFIKASQRSRILVVGGKAIAAITRPTRWRKRVVEDKSSDGKREVLDPIPQDEADISIKSANTLHLNIAGVDVLKEDGTCKI